MATYILVHGAWHGGWAWQDVATTLRAAGHSVLTPTLEGLDEEEGLIEREGEGEGEGKDEGKDEGEPPQLHGVMRHVEQLEGLIRTWLSHRDSLQAHAVLDHETCDHAARESGRDTAGNEAIVVVGHSYAGVLLAPLAERLPGGITQLIYLDAAVLEDGECFFDMMPPELADQRRRQAEANGGRMAIPGPEQMGIVDRQDWQRISHRLVGHPVITYHTPIALRGRPGEGVRCDYVECTAPSYQPLAWARERVRGYGWRWWSLRTGHDAMVTAPESLSQLLMQLVADANAG